MNYIKHLSAFLQKVKGDARLNPNHISMYLSLFHFWNQNLFVNPVSVNRAQVLELCKIGSQHTYYKCLKDLDLFGYIRYLPSHNPSKGCLVYLCNFDITQDEIPKDDSCKNSITIAAELHKYSCKNDITIAAKMQPSINNINNTNNKTIYMQNQDDFNSDLLSAEAQCLRLDNTNTPKRKKVAPKKEKAEGESRNLGNSVKQNEKPEIPPSPEQVKTFFKIQEYPELEAHKFYNHFQSNGWKVGGKSPMKDWHAAARNWMLNFNKFNPPMKSNATNLNKNKNYGEPL